MMQLKRTKNATLYKKSRYFFDLFYNNKNHKLKYSKSVNQNMNGDSQDSGSSKPKGTLQTGDRIGTMVAIILFVGTLLTGGLTIASAMLKTLGEFDVLMFFIFFTPVIQGALSVLVFKLTGQQIQDNNILNVLKIKQSEDKWNDEKKELSSRIQDLEKTNTKIENDLATANGRLRFYDETLNVNEWMRKQFNTNFGFFPPKKEKNCDDKDIDK